MKKTKILALLMSMAMLTSTAMPGTLAIESDSTTETICGKIAHTHGEENCWEDELVCELEETEGHTHDGECWTVETVTTCELTEDPHEHTDECYEQITAEEPSCGDESEEHEHEVDCYEVEEEQICTGEPTPHAHGDECGTAEEEKLTCELPESEPHQHGEVCYEETLTCGYAEEHTHTEECYPAEEPIFDLLMETEDFSRFYDLITDEGNQEKLDALTYDEITALLERTEELYSAEDAGMLEEVYAELYDLPEAPERPVEAEYCEFCGAELLEDAIHEEDCSFNEETELSSAEIVAYADGLTFMVSGMFPEGADLQVEPVETDAAEFIHWNILGLAELSDGYTGVAYDITIMVNGEVYQPEERVVVTVTGTDTTSSSDVSVYHLPDTTAEDIYQIMQTEMGIITFSLASDELKTMDDIEPDQLTADAGEGYIEFVTDSFSVYYIVAGTQSDSSSDDTFYILRGTSVELTNVTNDDYTVTYPDSTDAETSGAIITYDDGTLTFAATDNTTLGTYTIKFTRDTNNWWEDTATIHVLSPEEMFALPEDRENDFYNDVYFSVLGNSTEVPNEPMSGGEYGWNYITKNGGNYSFSTSYFTGAYQNSPDGFLKLNVIASSDALEQNLQGQNVIGVIDNGWGENTLPCVELTDEEWHEILKQFVDHSIVQISNGAGGTTRLTSDMVDEKLDDGSYRYKMYPYVIKLILESSEHQKGWHVDCAIVDTKTYSVSYERNLPDNAIVQENGLVLNVPATTFHVPGTAGVEVGVMTLDDRYNSNVVTGDMSVTIYDINTLSTSEYEFLYWNTLPDGSGTSYAPDDVLPAITSDVTLYAIWNHTQTSGEVKLQKTEDFEDPNDERKDDGVTYTFTVNITNAEEREAYPYTIYNADNTIKTQNLELVSGDTISLLGGEYAIVSNVPGGDVTITEVVSADSEFDVSWNVGSTTTEGETVTATVTAGNQAEIVCVNTYTPLVADLTIAKTGAQDIDVNQSFIFTVEGEGIEFDVVINGNGSVIIKDIPIGDYTVTESDWSGRYTPEYKSQSITVTANGENTVTFKNTRNEIKWLDGNASAKNVFDAIVAYSWDNNG